MEVALSLPSPQTLHMLFYFLDMEKLGVYQQDNWNFVSFLLVMEN